MPVTICEKYYHEQYNANTSILRSQRHNPNLNKAKATKKMVFSGE